jgi:hypothetical protein
LTQRKKLEFARTRYTRIRVKFCSNDKSFWKNQSRIGVIRLIRKKSTNSPEFLSILLNSHHEFVRNLAISGEFTWMRAISCESSSSIVLNYYYISASFFLFYSTDFSRIPSNSGNFQTKNWVCLFFFFITRLNILK